MARRSVHAAISAVDFSRLIAIYKKPEPAVLVFEESTFGYFSTRLGETPRMGFPTAAVRLVGPGPNQGIELTGPPLGA